MIKLTATSLVLFSLLISALLYFYQGEAMALSGLLGGGIMLVNLFGIYLAWHLIISKKSIALAVFVIIFKYLILGAVLWNLAAMGWIKPLGLISGLSTLVLAILSATLMKGFVKTNKTL